MSRIRVVGLFAYMIVTALSLSVCSDDTPTAAAVQDAIGDAAASDTDDTQTTDQGGNDVDVEDDLASDSVDEGTEDSVDDPIDESSTDGDPILAEVDDEPDVADLADLIDDGGAVTDLDDADGGDEVDVNDATLDADLVEDVPSDVDAEPEDFLLTVVLTGTGIGSVTSDPPGIDCGRGGDQCSHRFEAGTEVELFNHQWPFPGWELEVAEETANWFTGWIAGPCTANGECVISMTYDYVVEAMFSAVNLVFATSELVIAGGISGLYPDIDGGLASADQLCTDLADAANLPGTFVAWLSNESTDAHARVTAGLTPSGWIRVDGRPFANTLEELYSGVIFHPVGLDERGNDISDHPAIVTGTSTGGIRDDTQGWCSDWSEPNPAGEERYRAGWATRTTESWTNSGISYCYTTERRLMCMGVDRVSEVLPPQREGRLAFVSNGSFTADTGLETADALCQTESGFSLEERTFYALLATVDSSAMSRFDDVLDGPPWVRPDGMMLAETAESFFSGGAILAPLNVSYVAEPEPGHGHVGLYRGDNDRAWTGTEDLTQTVNPNACGHWDVSDGRGEMGWVNDTMYRRYALGDYACGGTGRIYCLQR